MQKLVQASHLSFDSHVKNTIKKSDRMNVASSAGGESLLQAVQAYIVGDAASTDVRGAEGSKLPFGLTIVGASLFCCAFWGSIAWMMLAH